MNSDHTPVNLEVRALNQQDVAYDDGRPLARDTAPGWKAALVVCALMAIFVIAVQGLVQPWIDLMLPFLEEADVKSEFAPHEQASNYLLLIMMAAGIAGHRFAVDGWQLRLSVGFILLGVAMYAAESDFIREMTLPVLAGPMLLIIGAGLLRTRRWMLLVFAAAIAFLVLGATIDFVSDHPELVASFDSSGLLERGATSLNEEVMELVGVAMMCLIPLLLFLPPLVRLTQANTAGAVLMLLAFALVAWGNGFLHYNYYRPMHILLLGGSLSGIGCLGAIATNQWLIRPRDRLVVLPQTGFYLVLILALCVLPVVYRMPPRWVNLTIWAIALLTLGWYLQRRSRTVVSDCPRMDPALAAAGPSRSRSRSRGQWS